MCVCSVSVVIVIICSTVTSPAHVDVDLLISPDRNSLSAPACAGGLVCSQFARWTACRLFGFRHHLQLYNNKHNTNTNNTTTNNNTHTINSIIILLQQLLLLLLIIIIIVIVLLALQTLVPAPSSGASCRVSASCASLARMDTILCYAILYCTTLYYNILYHTKIYLCYTMGLRSLVAPRHAGRALRAPGDARGVRRRGQRAQGGAGVQRKGSCARGGARRV